MDDISVSAASSANRMPMASPIPMLLTSLKSQIIIAPNPIMTAAPDVNTDSPAQVIAAWQASSCPSPRRLSSLYLERMNMQ